MISGTVLTPFYWTHSTVPAQIRQGNVLVAAILGVNFSTAFVFLQLHRRAPIANQVPLYSVPFPPDGSTVALDATHLCGDGIASDDMWVALSLSQVVYQAAITANGSVQLMIR